MKPGEILRPSRRQFLRGGALLGAGLVVGFHWTRGLAKPLAAQQTALTTAGPGATLTEVHDATVRVLTEGMLEIGLLEGDLDELLARDAHRAYYMHNTSHWLGLDVHDVGTYRVDGKPRALESGLVFTVEPGVYIAPDDEEADAAFRGIGVRIEDDVAITSDGCENLTAAIPKDPAEVEAWMRG